MKLYEEMADYKARSEQGLPGVMAAHAAFRDKEYKGGALSRKVKRRNT